MPSIHNVPFNYSVVQHIFSFFSISISLFHFFYFFSTFFLLFFIYFTFLILFFPIYYFVFFLIILLFIIFFNSHFPAVIALKTLSCDRESDGWIYDRMTNR